MFATDLYPVIFSCQEHKWSRLYHTTRVFRDISSIQFGVTNLEPMGLVLELSKLNPDKEEVYSFCSMSSLKRWVKNWSYDNEHIIHHCYKRGWIIYEGGVGRAVPLTNWIALQRLRGE